MTISELLEKVKTAVDSQTGKSYAIRWDTADNISEQAPPNGGILRFIKIANFRKERISRGSPQTQADVLVGAFANDTGNTDAVLKAIWEELDGVMTAALKVDSFVEGTTVKAGETTPAFDTIASLDEYEDRAKIISAGILLGLRY